MPFTLNDLNNFKEYVEKLHKDILNLNLPLSDNGKETIEDLFSNDTKSTRSFYHVIDAMEKGVKDGTLLKDDRESTHAMADIKNKLAEPIGIFFNFWANIDDGYEGLIVPLYQQVREDMLKFDDSFDGSSPLFRGACANAALFMSIHKNDPVNAPKAPEEKEAEPQPEENDEVNEDVNEINVVISQKGIDGLRVIINAARKSIDKNATLKGRLSPMLDGLDNCCKNIADSITPENDTPEANELRLNLKKFLEHSSGLLSNCEKENEKDFLTYFKGLISDLMVWNIDNNFQILDFIGPADESIQNYEKAKNEAQEKQEEAAKEDEPQEELSKESIEKALKQLDAEREAENEAANNDYVTDFHLTKYTEANDIQVLSETGSDEYTRLKTQVTNEDASSEDLFDASWNYLRRKDSTPWTTEGKRRVESAAKVMADAALVLLSKEGPDEVGEARINAIKAEAARSPSFRKYMTEGLFKLADDDCRCGAVATDLYAVMKFTDLTCKKAHKDILIKGKMNTEDITADPRYRQALEGAQKYSRFIDKHFDNLMDTRMYINDQYHDLMERLHLAPEVKPDNNNVQPQRNPEGPGMQA